jgi:hypothetical protein
LSVAEVRRQLVAQKGYQSEMLPSEETIRQRINGLGYRLKRVARVCQLFCVRRDLWASCPQTG